MPIPRVGSVRFQCCSVAFPAVRVAPQDRGQVLHHFLHRALQGPRSDTAGHSVGKGASIAAGRGTHADGKNIRLYYKYFLMRDFFFANKYYHEKSINNCGQ